MTWEEYNQLIAYGLTPDEIACALFIEGPWYVSVRNQC